MPESSTKEHMRRNERNKLVAAGVSLRGNQDQAWACNGRFSLSRAAE